MKNKIFGVLGTLVLSASMLVSTGSVVFASKSEAWEQSVMTYGVTLTPEQITETKRLLGIKNATGYKEVIVNGADLMKYLPDAGFDEGSDVFSSTFIEKTAEGAGVNVEIIGNTDSEGKELPINQRMITVKTETQYRNAAITSGITDASIKVATAVRVDGSGALAGVYKAYDESVPATTAEETAQRAESREVAQQELDTTSAITTEHADTEGFSDESLGLAVNDVKRQLAEIAQKQETLATKQDIEDMLNKALKQQDLNNIVTESDVSNLAVPLMAFQSLPVATDANTLGQLESINEDIRKNASDWLNGAKDKLDSTETSGFFNSIGKFFKGIGNFFSNTWKAVVGSFKGGESDNSSSESTESIGNKKDDKDLESSSDPLQESSVLEKEEEDSATNPSTDSSSINTTTETKVDSSTETSVDSSTVLE